MECPCNTCEKKGCGAFHSKCKEYLAFVEWKKFVNEEERKFKARTYKEK